MEIPQEMVNIPAKNVQVNAGNLPGLGTKRVDRNQIDRYEVTNRDFKRFVDAGGYRKKEFWKHPFQKDGLLAGGFARFRQGYFAPSFPQVSSAEFESRQRIRREMPPYGPETGSGLKWRDLAVAFLKLLVPVLP